MYGELPLGRRLPRKPFKAPHQYHWNPSSQALFREHGMQSQMQKAPTMWNQGTRTETTKAEMASASTKKNTQPVLFADTCERITNIRDMFPEKHKTASIMPGSLPEILGAILWREKAALGTLGSIWKSTRYGLRWILMAQYGLILKQDEAICGHRKYFSGL